MRHKNLTLMKQFIVDEALKEILVLSDQCSRTLDSAMELWLQSRQHTVSDWCREALKKECS